MGRRLDRSRLRRARSAVAAVRPTIGRREAHTRTASSRPTVGHVGSYRLPADQRCQRDTSRRQQPVGGRLWAASRRRTPSRPPISERVGLSRSHSSHPASPARREPDGRPRQAERRAAKNTDSETGLMSTRGESRRCQRQAAISLGHRRSRSLRGIRDHAAGRQSHGRRGCRPKQTIQPARPRSTVADRPAVRVGLPACCRWLHPVGPPRRRRPVGPVRQEQRLTTSTGRQRHRSSSHRPPSRRLFETSYPDLQHHGTSRRPSQPTGDRDSTHRQQPRRLGSGRSRGRPVDGPTGGTPSRPRYRPHKRVGESSRRPTTPSIEGVLPQCRRQWRRPDRGSQASLACLKTSRRWKGWGRRQQRRRRIRTRSSRAPASKERNRAFSTAMTWPSPRSPSSDDHDLRRGSSSRSYGQRCSARQRPREDGQRNTELPATRRTVTGRQRPLRRPVAVRCPDAPRRPQATPPARRRPGIDKHRLAVGHG